MAVSAIRRSRLSLSMRASAPKNKSNDSPSTAPAITGNAASLWIHHIAAIHKGTNSHSPRLRKSLQRALRSRRIKRSATGVRLLNIDGRRRLSSCCAVCNLHKSVQKSTRAASASKRTANTIGALVKKSTGSAGGKAKSNNTSAGAARLSTPLTKRRAVSRQKARKEDKEDKKDRQQKTNERPSSHTAPSHDHSHSPCEFARQATKPRSLGESEASSVFLSIDLVGRSIVGGVYALRVFRGAAAPPMAS